MVPEKGPKVDPKPYPLWGSQVLRNTRNSNGFGAFRPLGWGPVLDTFLGTFWAQFRDPRISELFPNIEELVQAK